MHPEDLVAALVGASSLSIINAHEVTLHFDRQRDVARLVNLMIELWGDRFVDAPPGAAGAPTDQGGEG